MVTNKEIDVSITVLILNPQVCKVERKANCVFVAIEKKLQIGDIFFYLN